MIGLIGLDHHWATAQVRGRLTFAGDHLLGALRQLAADSAFGGVALLSTCNRTEVYFSTTDFLAAKTAVERFFAGAYSLGATTAGADLARHSSLGAATADGGAPPAMATLALPDDVAQVLYTYEDTAAARHLFRVAAGLQSLVIGEAQILGQVKDALTAAESVHTLDDELRGLLTQAIKVGKRVRSETEIGRADVSVAALAVHVASEALGGLGGKNALVIGAGKTSQLCARLLRREGIARLLLANRTLHVAAAVAREVDAESLALGGIATVIPEVSLIISATAAPSAVLAAETVANAVRERQAPLLIVDLAVPPDVEEAVGSLPQVSLYTMDTLRALDGTGGASFLPVEGGREAELAQAQRIIEDGVHEYLRSLTIRMAAPSIAALRRHVDRSEESELARALAQLQHLSPEDRAVISRFGQRLVDKMFHHLVSRVRSLAEYDEVPPDVTMRVLAQLFADPDERA